MLYTLDILTIANADGSTPETNQFTETGWNVSKHELFIGRSGKIMKRTILAKTVPADHVLTF